MKNPGSSPTGLAAAMALALIPCGAQTARADADGARARHVIVISVDGLHESDLEAYIASHATSTLAKFVNEGVSYSNAHTPFPSDSFPGLTAIMTGAHPRSAGVYYDDSWNRSLLPAGTTSCAGVAPGVEVTYFEQLDIDLNSIDAGSGVGDLSTFAAIRQNIYKMSQQARDAIDPKQLPVDPATCQPVYPHTYLRVNTIFEVAKAHGLHT
ncbi:MAG: alkaline phosphatase family protein, partial [Gammaproteobacteria bacterium]